MNKIGDNFPIPIEISPIAWKITKKIIEGLNVLNCHLRKNTAGDGFAITSYGNLVLDCNFKYSDIYNLSQKLSEVPGVLEHGIFLETYLVLISNKGKIKKYGPVISD